MEILYDFDIDYKQTLNFFLPMLPQIFLLLVSLYCVLKVRNLEIRVVYAESRIYTLLSRIDELKEDLEELENEESSETEGETDEEEKDDPKDEDYVPPADETEED